MVLKIALALLILTGFAPWAHAEPARPLPFEATYSVIYRGFAAGYVHAELRVEGSGRYVYETRGEPGVLARLVVGRDVVERTEMQIDAQGVRPLAWRMNHGRLGDGGLEFSWESGTVAGTVDGERVELPTEPGLQDRLSVQIAVITALRRGEEPGTIPMIDGDEIKHYSYTRVGSETVRIGNGEVEAILYESTRPGSSRVSRVWHVPSLDYIPIRMERLRGGRVETVMSLERVEAR